MKKEEFEKAAKLVEKMASKKTHFKLEEFVDEMFKLGKKNDCIIKYMAFTLFQKMTIDRSLMQKIKDWVFAIKNKVVKR